ncbi:MAG: EAL domain-containing protein [Spirochaetia bacterium]|nr:EAL domain-containing protein [Spirochaetia bacterium]
MILGTQDNADRTDSSYDKNDQVLVALNSIGDGVLLTDKKGVVIFFNKTAQSFLAAIGQSLNENNATIYIQDILIFYHDETRLPISSLFERGEKDNAPVKLYDIHVKGKHGYNHYLEVLVNPTRTSDNLINGFVTVLKDITHARVMAEKLKWQAEHDPLTGILNRRAFEDHLIKTLELAVAENSDHVMLYLDLDQFKLINDICGHIAGDELLKILSSKITMLLNENCIFARLGGDEFGVILKKHSLEEADHIANQILNLIKLYEFRWGKKNYKLGVSIGMVPIYASSISIAHIMSMADIACYTAKDLGRNRIQIYVGGEQEYQTRHAEMQLVSQIKKAIQENKFVLYVHDIIPASNNKLKIHREILVRMIGDDEKLIFPTNFIGAAERYNIIQDLDKWIILNTFKTISLRNKLNVDPVVYCINLSGSSINDTSLSIYILECLEKYKLRANQFCFEITENAAIDNFSYAREFMRELKMSGFSFALDDFGSGLSSFNYLKNLPVDFLKIDGNFIRNMDKDSIDFAMVEAIHHIGATLNIKTIAEFVENRDILEMLRQIGVDYVQGYAISEPQAL